jgi:hypothetical protein
MMNEQTVWYKVKCKWARGRFVGKRVMPIEEPLKEFCGNIKATSRTTAGQLQYLVAMELCKIENVSPVYICDLRMLDKTIEYTKEYKQISMFERSVYA